MRRATLLLLALCGCGDPNLVTLTSTEARVDVTVEPFSFVVRNPAGEPLLSSLTGGGAEATGSYAGTADKPTYVEQVVPGWDGYRANEGPWARGGKARLVSKDGSRCVVAFDVAGGTATVTLSVAGPRVRVETSLVGADGRAPAGLNKTTLGFALPADEHFFGLGERFGTFDHRGQSLYSWAEEGALGQGENAPVRADNPFPNGPSMTYFPVPFFLSSRGYGLHVDTTFRSELHLGTERADAWRLAVNAPRFALTVYVHDEPLASLDAFTADTGRPIVPAAWVFGPRRRISPGSTVDGGLEWQVMRERRLPLTGIDDAVHFLPALSHVGREAELRAWTSTLHAHGYKVMAYNNPYVARGPMASAADYAHGLDAGFFVQEVDDTPSLVFLISGSPLTVAMVDFTSEAAAAWYRGLLQRTVDLGYDGWMHDFGEYVPRNSKFADGRRGDELHNLYPVLSAKAAREVLQAARPDDHLFFVRAGYTGSQAYVPAVWGGDAETSFDETQGIPSTIRSGLNLALSGVPYWGSDGTGFKCIGNEPRDKEVYLRWLELEAVSPIMMDQNACANPLGRRAKWTLWSDDETQDVYRRMAGLHTRLLPYFQVLAREAHERGAPLMRPPFLFFPKEPRTWTLDDTFFLGPALYAAPVLRRGVTRREVWLPPGRRYLELNVFSVHAGGAVVTVDAPLTRLPLFLVEGELLPMLDDEVQTLAPATEPGVVTVQRVGDVEAVRVTSERAESTAVSFDELVLSAQGPTARRVRWEVFRLP